MEALERILAHHGRRPALLLEGRPYSYAEVIDRALALAARLAALADEGVVGLLAHRSLAAYVGVLACHCAGLGYLPLHPGAPVERLATMIRRGGTRLLVVGDEAKAVLPDLLAALPAGEPLVVLTLAGEGPGLAGPRPRDASATAYLLFTSGSTGVPKGVPVSFANLEAYLATALKRWPLAPEDRASQSFDLTFDLSVHDIFVTWISGACLCPLSEAALLSPAGFIRQTELTVWFSVPSVAMFMARARTLRPGALPSLRLSLFCGEALPAATAEAWAAAAPHSRLVNLYGPTEATIAIAAQDWDGAARAMVSPDGVVPIGRMFAGQQHCLLAEGRAVAGPGRGELCLSGAQVTAGYLDDPERTAAQFLTIPGREGRWYRTGDLVEEDGDGVLHYLGRLDFQVKVNGHRVELGEVEVALRRATGCDGVVAVPWPVDGAGSARGLVAFVLGEEEEAAPVLAACRRLLPDYMVPSRILWREDLPLNANGKIDRRALADQLARSGGC